MEESIFSHLMILVAVIVVSGFIHLMDWIDRRFVKEEGK
jgi:preprotein translocase subunit SecE